MFDYIDVHSHVNFNAFDVDRDETIKRALDAGVYVINVGTQQDTSKKAVEMAEKYERGVYAIVGLHPVHTGKSFHDVKELGEGNREFTSRGEVFDKNYYLELARHPKVVGIGECGLDYYRFKIEDLSWKKELEKQEETFRKHIELAIEVGKPLMLHVRNGGGRSAYRDSLSILKSYNFNLKSSPGDFHFFAGSWEEAKEILDAGFNLSFTGVITFARDYDEVIKNTPLDRIMTETDSPYVSPVPYRGKRNEPLYVQEVVKAIANIRNENFEIVKKQLVANAIRFFSLF
ncbi:MAG: TatD family deoxyribonuclease [Candidatus Taylorbacteria bacterium]|nr:TatD family deoxyribonuclease [Candidatus Taylorbacteria bacterium]